MSKRRTFAAATLITTAFIISVLLTFPRSEPVSAQAKVSFTKDVKPIFDAKCVACHACYDSPAQLDLTAAKGVERGAIKLDPYVPRMEPIPSTLLVNSPNTMDDWRKIGFFSVIDGGENSIMAKMLELGQRNPVQPNARFTSSIELDSLKRKNFMPNALELDGYAKAHPTEGMPLAVSGLTAKEYATVFNWLKQGAAFDYVTPQPTAVERAKIAEWEAYLNGTDNRSRLVGRYIYEHHNLFLIHFDKASSNFFRMIRSSTPADQEAVPVRARVPNDPVEGAVYYRLVIADQTRCAKLHQLLLDATGNKLDRYKKIFSETKWNVDRLPGYTMEERVDPLNTFAAIPAKARWKFLLADVRLHRSTIAYGPVCRGNLIVGAVQEVEWDFFEDPETSLYVNDAQYRADLAPLLALPSEPEDMISVLSSARDLVERRKTALTKAMARHSANKGRRSRLADIWRGDEPGDTPLVVIYRNDDNAFAAEAGAAIGDFPKTTMVLDLPILERMMYESVVNFDLFGSVATWLVYRESFGLDRRAAELNFLRFLPQDKRRAIYESWYQGKATQVRRKLEKDIVDLGPDVKIPTGITFKTNDPKREFQSMLLRHVRFTNTADPINRPQPGDNHDRVTRAFQGIISAASRQQPTWRKFKTFLPEATFLRVDAPGREPSVYTMTHDRDLATKAFALSLLQHDDPGKAKVTIYPGVLTAYPNFMFRIDENDIDEFASRLIDADTPEKFTAVVERWGVRRSSPDFWQTLHSITDYVRRKNPLHAAVFDVNRYKNL